jgi:deoxyribonuclease-4
MEKNGVEVALSHDSYLINLAAPAGPLRRRSVASFLAEVRRCEALGIAAVVFHPGAHLGAGESVGIRRIAAALREVLRRSYGARVRLYLETTAGQGSAIGWRFEHLRDLLDLAGDSRRTGVCFDTCHVHAAGYDLSTEAAYARAMEAFDRVVGTSRIGAFHLNDSKRECGSRVDRHHHIGRGTIGIAGFRALARDFRFFDVPKVLETPKGIDLASGRDWDAVNLARLRRIGMR